MPKNAQSMYSLMSMQETQSGTLDVLFGEVIDLEAGGMCQKLDFVIEEVLH
jgi:hypothetical protein